MAKTIKLYNTTSRKSSDLQEAFPKYTIVDRYDEADGILLTAMALYENTAMRALRNEKSIYVCRYSDDVDAIMELQEYLNGSLYRHEQVDSELLCHFMYSYAKAGYKLNIRVDTNERNIDLFNKHNVTIIIDGLKIQVADSNTLSAVAYHSIDPNLEFEPSFTKTSIKALLAGNVNENITTYAIDRRSKYYEDVEEAAIRDRVDFISINRDTFTIFEYGDGNRLDGLRISILPRSHVRSHALSANQHSPRTTRRRDGSVACYDRTKDKRDI